MALKVYGFTGMRLECDGPHHQTREIVAAKSWAEVARISGKSVSYLRTYGSTTGNAEEIQAAMSEPGKILWKALNDWGRGGGTLWHVVSA